MQKRVLFSLFIVIAGLFVLAQVQGNDAFFIQLDQLFMAPNGSFWLGSDELGRDILSRLVQGVQLSLTVAFCVLMIAGTIGITAGVVSGWFGGWVDLIVMRICEVFLSFPGILIAIAFAAAAGPSTQNVILALGFMGWVTFARLARVQTLAIKTEDYVQAAKMSGVPTVRLLAHYVLPNIAAPLVVEAAFTAAGAIVAEAGLSFLGIGVQPPLPSLGSMLKEGARYMLTAPHLVIAPGVAFMVLVLVFYTLGDLLRDHLDKKV